MEATPLSNHKTARLAALLFFTVCVPWVAWGLSYVPSKIFVLQDATATANNLLSHEFLFRTGIVSHFVSNITFVFVTLLFYRIFRSVDKHLARIMLVPVLAQVPIVFVLELFRITALMIVKGGVLTGLALVQKQEFVYLLLRMHSYGNGAAQFLWGLHFFPFGMVVYRSGFIPRIFPILMMITGIGYVADTSAFILLQRNDYLIVRPFIMITFLGGGLTMLWFLIKGVREQKTTINSK